MSHVTDSPDMADRPRFLTRLGPADLVTVANAAVGFAACVFAFTDRAMAARLLLVAGIADGLDGVIARKVGGTALGPHLDSLADVASFGVAPALVIVSLVRAETAGPLAAAALVVAAGYVACGVVRLGVYTVEDEGAVTTHGVQTTLAATVVASATLAGIARPALVVGVATVLAVGMVTPVVYPDLHAQDAGVMGVVQAMAVVLPGRPGEIFAFALLFLAVGYTVLGPRFYWRTVPADGRKPGDGDDEPGEGGDPSVRS